MSESIKLQNIWVRFERDFVLRDVSFLLNSGDFLGLIGPNGGGKTTLLRVILGLIKPERGSVEIFGQNIKNGRDQIGYVPQIPSVDRNFPITVLEVVLMGITKKRGLFHPFCQDDINEAKKALSDVDLLAFQDRPLGELSGGEMQRVFIARALSSDPQILLFDEPTASVDVKMQKGFYELLNRIRKSKTIILVSHDIGVIAEHVDKIACLNQRLFFHDSKELTMSSLSELYHCPVEMIAHGIPHRVLGEHE